ncbi:putative peptide transport permease protein [subsurface metagenome]
MKTLRELCRDSRFSIGAAVLFVLGVLALLTLFSPYDPTVWHVVPLELPPSWEHLLGTTSMGQDVFWQMTFAVRNSFQLAILATIIVAVIAVVVGSVAGFCGGVVDRVLMFFTDAMLVIPVFLILVLLSLVARDYMNLVTLALILGIMGWAWNARVIRSQILSLREREFTYTAILSGAPVLKLIFNEYIPFITPLILATLLGTMGWVIGIEITLALIGLTNLTIPTLGAMLQFALGHAAMLRGLWWWIFAPVGVAIAAVVALYLMSVSIGEYLDPRTRLQRIGAR